MSLAPVVDQIAATMSLQSRQHAVIASNIANREALGYQRMALRFDALMDGTTRAEAVADTSADVPSLEADLVALSANGAHYTALARILTRYFSIVTAITSSNRG